MRARHARAAARAGPGVAGQRAGARRRRRPASRRARASTRSAGCAARRPGSPSSRRSPAAVSRACRAAAGPARSPRRAPSGCARRAAEASASSSATLRAQPAHLLVLGGRALRGPGALVGVRAGRAPPAASRAARSAARASPSLRRSAAFSSLYSSIWARWSALRSRTACSASASRARSRCRSRPRRPAAVRRARRTRRYAVGDRRPPSPRAGSARRAAASSTGSSGRPRGRRRARHLGAHPLAEPVVGCRAPSRSRCSRAGPGAPGGEVGDPSAARGRQPDDGGQPTSGRSAPRPATRSGSGQLRRGPGPPRRRACRRAASGRRTGTHDAHFHAPTAGRPVGRCGPGTSLVRAASGGLSVAASSVEHMSQHRHRARPPRWESQRSFDELGPPAARPDVLRGRPRDHRRVGRRAGR